MNRKLLWIGDADVASGFARCTHKVLDVLRETWEVHVLGLNYGGDPHDWPYPIYPCMPGGDGFGVGRTASLVNGLKPDVVIVQNDPWNVPMYLKKIGNVPSIASMPVDGKNCRGNWLNGLTHAIFWTEFGRKEAQLGGYSGDSSVVPLGVDLEVYRRQYDPLEARKMGRLPEYTHEAYIVGNVNRNQPRKRLDLTVAYFAEWVKAFDVRDAFLFLHVAPTGDQGYDVSQLMKYYGLSNRLILAEPEIGLGISESGLNMTYSCFDVQISTTQGEGWGLTHMEGMACRVPQIVPDWAALGEWPGDTVVKVPCSEICVTPNHINAIGGIADRGEFIKALDLVYRDQNLRRSLAARGRELVVQPQFRWRAIGERFREVIDEALSPARIAC
jgi:glycosyltransferase involved in cell wall biosynthesis